jgi:hypothetical protein
MILLSNPILTMRFTSRLLSPEVIALAEKLLHMNRYARPSATEAMEDSYFSCEPLPSPPEYAVP